MGLPRSSPPVAARGATPSHRQRRIGQPTAVFGAMAELTMSFRRVRPLGWEKRIQTQLGQAEVPAGHIALWAEQPVSTLGLVTLNHFLIFVTRLNILENC
jgi:hypothetical protein